MQTTLNAYQYGLGAVLHIRLNGRAFDVALYTLGITAGSRDHLIKQVVAHDLDIPVRDLDDYAIDRHANGNLTLRPLRVWADAAD
jgi:hypothetical protein